MKIIKIKDNCIKYIDSNSIINWTGKFDTRDEALQSINTIDNCIDSRLPLAFELKRKGYILIRFI